MARIRAFVGHSFAEADAALVRTFTDYFNALKHSPLDFEWVHATEARPEDVSAKVLELIKGKNLFIGICTKNKRAAKHDAFKPAMFSKRLIGDEKEFDWKTSDWIIQEIGLALGRGMKPVLLVEEGVRQPGGLQGNTEYIPFKREAPEQSFQKIFEMISSLDPLSGISSETPGREALPPNQTDESDEALTNTLCVPDASADLDEYEHQFLMGLLYKDEEHSNNVSKAYLETLNPSDHDAIGEWRSFCELFKLKWTEHGNLSALVALGDEHGSSSSVQEDVAKGYLHFNDLAKAQHHFRAAINCSDERNRKIDLLGELASIAQKKDSGKSISAIVAEMRELVDSPETEDRLLAKLTDLNDWYHDDILKVAMLERELSINPTDTEKRFQLAYLHSQIGNAVLSMFHYEKIPANERNGLTWNNLRVAYKDISLSTKSVDAYRKSAEKGETLAMSNLAYLFMNAGFLREAEEMLQKAHKVPNCHDNVASALVRLNEIPTEETKTRDDKLKGMNAKSNFLSHVGEHLWVSAPEIVPNTMTDPDCEVNVTIDGDLFVATGTFQKKEVSPANALAGTGGRSQTETYTVEYRGRMVGKVAIGKRTKKKKHSGLIAPSLLDFGLDSPKFIIVMPEGMKKVRGMIDNDLLDFELGD